MSVEDRKAIVVAVVSAAATTLATGLVSWALEVAKGKTEEKKDEDTKL